ncbi:MAG TPA: DUF1616 domain-containing protein, partial [Candidatus Moranbacteria bacterium]|nr:DUF1616 domain-containing protein [Candidatus Moranbacteria bacterium]
MSFIFQQILFFISIALVLFVPGYFLILATWGKRKIFTDLEKFIISFGLSIVIIDFLMILAGKIGISLNIVTILLLILIFAATCFGIYKKRFKKEIVEGEERELAFSKNQIILIILIILLTLFIKTIYLTNTIFPTSTDLGHHMYWSKQISQTGELPVYEKMEITENNGDYQISEPQPIADFIIGEHLIFSAINLISRIPFISYFPSLVLLLINILGVLATFILTLRLFKNCEQGKNISIFALLLLGPLYTISSSQAKFVSGGVVGNILGNLLIPLSLYFYFRALKEKSSAFLTLALFITAGIFYTHHLSALVFVYVFAFALLTFTIFNLKNIIKYTRNWLNIIWSKPVIIFLLFTFIFSLFVYTPSYIETGAVETAVGGPSKATRAGLTFTQLKFTAGEARMVLGIIG